MINFHYFLGGWFALVTITSGMLYRKLCEMKSRIEKQRIGLEMFKATLIEPLDEFEQRLQEIVKLANKLRSDVEDGISTFGRTTNAKKNGRKRSSDERKDSRWMSSEEKENDERISPEEKKDDERNVSSDRKDDGTMSCGMEDESERTSSEEEIDGTSVEENAEDGESKTEKDEEAFIRACREAAENVCYKRFPARNKLIPFEYGFKLILLAFPFKEMKLINFEAIHFVIYRNERCIRKLTSIFHVGKYCNEVQIMSILNGAGGAPILRAVNWSFTTFIMDKKWDERLESVLLVKPGTLQLKTLKQIMKKICLRVKELHLKGVSHNSLSLKNVMVSSSSDEFFLVDFHMSSLLGRPFLPFQGNYMLPYVRKTKEIVLFLTTNVSHGIVTTAYDIHCIGKMMLEIMKFHDIVNKPLEDLAIQAVEFNFGVWPSVEQFVKDIENVPE